MNIKLGAVDVQMSRRCGFCRAEHLFRSDQGRLDPGRVFSLGAVLSEATGNSA